MEIRGEEACKTGLIRVQDDSRVSPVPPALPPVGWTGVGGPGTQDLEASCVGPGI